MDIINHSLGEMFYQGKMVNLSSVEPQELENMWQEFEENQVIKKEAIKVCLNRMREEA